jgi:hypothetical protein
MYQKNDQPPRSLPITFTEVPVVKKPGKRQRKEKQQYKIKERGQSFSIFSALCITG